MSNKNLKPLLCADWQAQLLCHLLMPCDSAPTSHRNSSRGRR